MTKTLTEQWKKGTLKYGEYYIKHVDGRVLTDWFNGHEFRGLYKIDIEEVLAPVPSYDEYNELDTKCNQLQKRLEIATKALKKYKEDYFLTEYGGRSVNPYPDIARKALKEMEGVK